MAGEIKLHKGQSEVLRYLFKEPTGVRYATVCASRGFGKSYTASVAATMAVHELMQMPDDMPNKNVSLICPTYQQACDIYFPLLAHTLGLDEYSEKNSLASGTFWFPGNVKLKLWSYEASERMRGSGQYFVVADEVEDWTGNPGLKESWESVIQPTMTTRWPGNHKALIIGTPKGYSHFYDMTNYGGTDERWRHFHYTYRDSPFLSADEIERTKRLIDPIKFQREYEASFEDSGARVFYTFNRKLHVTGDLPYFTCDSNSKEDVHVAIDFNIGKHLNADVKLRELLETLRDLMSYGNQQPSRRKQFQRKVQRLEIYLVHPSGWKH